MAKKRRYEPPVALDLGGTTASGQVQPMSTCANGSNPGTGSCLTGWVPYGGSVCNPTGSSPNFHACSFGLLATPVACTNGSVPTPS